MHFLEELNTIVMAEIIVIKDLQTLLKVLNPQSLILMLAVFIELIAMEDIINTTTHTKFIKVVDVISDDDASDYFHLKLN